MKLRFVVAASIVLFPWCAFGVDSTRPSVADNAYGKALSHLEEMSQKGLPIANDVTFRQMNWIERLAALNFLCRRPDEMDDCRKVIGLGLQDRALVVRDQALRMMLATAIFVEKEKSDAAEQVVKDEQNYRNGVPLWIVERAQNWIQKNR